MIGKSVLAWRAEYYRGDGNAVRYIEWVVATNYGIGLFQIRQQGKQRPTFTVETQIKTFGWLDKQGQDAASRHLFLNKMRRRCDQLGARVVALHQASIEELEETWMLGELFQNDAKAHNAWCNITGVPVGQTFEEIAAAAEVLVAQTRENKRVELVAALSQSDETWGMF